MNRLAHIRPLRPFTGFALALALAVSAACDGDSPEAEWTSPVTFDTTQALVHGDGEPVRLLVEVASTDRQRQFGLMMRDALDRDSGMIFLFDEERPGEAGFWMWRTRMPLDIAFLDAEGVIVRILQMDPCPSLQYAQACPTYPPGVPYHSALEVNQGWFAAHGFAEGARVELEAP